MIKPSVKPVRGGETAPERVARLKAMLEHHMLRVPPTSHSTPDFEGDGILLSPPGTGPCSHLRKHARTEAGDIKKIACGTCPGSAIDLFLCDHPGTPGEVSLLDCSRCQYRPGGVAGIERVYVINLRHRPERLAAFLDRQKTAGWALPEVRVFPAIGGDQVGVPNHFRQGGGAWGCLRSHCSILETCIMEGVASVMIMEDDAEWFPDAWDRLTPFMQAVPADWSQLMLGGQHMASAEQVSPGVVRCKNTQRTHAYVIRGEAMRSLLRAWYGATVHIDWIMGGDWQRGWPVYAPEPFLFGQAGGKSDISGRLNHSLYWNSPMNDPIIFLDAPPAVAAELRDHGLHMGFARDADGVDSGLRSIVKAGSSTEALQGYITTLTWEVASMRGRVATLWCPGLDKEIVGRAHSGPVRTVQGETLAKCLRLCRGLGLKRNYITSHVLVVRADRETVETLAGFHRGYWLDPETGQDRGLMEAVAGDHVAGLQRWAKHTFVEAERMQAVPLVWHEGIQLHEVQQAFPDRACVEIRLNTAKGISKSFRKNARLTDRSGRVHRTRADLIAAGKGE